MNSLWNLFVAWSTKIGMPFVLIYFAICSDPFLNTAAEDAKGLEKCANTVLIPFQYFFNGKVATPLLLDGEIHYVLEDRFTYETHFFIKSAASMVCLIPSVVIGSSLKALALLWPGAHTHHKNILTSLNSRKILSNLDQYLALGLNLTSPEFTKPLECQNYKRRPEDIFHLKEEKEALKQIVTLLKKQEILFWVDCGTLLGTYRYGGIIPWDHDIDIGVLKNDFDNVLSALKDLDPKKYTVLDWSCRGKPKSLLKVYVKKTQKMIDIYHFKIDKEEKTLQLLFSFDEHFFFADWWKNQERRFTKPISYDTIFPLRKALFDGIEVYAPNKTLEYLHTFYGENIEPSMLYDEKTCQYEKDLKHPYWAF